MACGTSLWVLWRQHHGRSWPWGTGSRLWHWAGSQARAAVMSLPFLQPLSWVLHRPQSDSFQATFLALLLREMERQGRTLQCYFYFYFKHESKVCGQGAFYLTQQHRTQDMGREEQGEGWWVHSDQKDSTVLWWCCGPLPPAPEDGGAAAFTLEAGCSEKHLYDVLLSRYPATSLFEGSMMDWGEWFWSHSWSTERSVSGQKAGNWWWEPAGTEKGFGWLSFRCSPWAPSQADLHASPSTQLASVGVLGGNDGFRTPTLRTPSSFFLASRNQPSHCTFHPRQQRAALCQTVWPCRKIEAFFGPRNLQL